jgi:hypothetical protein
MPGAAGPVLLRVVVAVTSAGRSGVAVPFATAVVCAVRFVVVYAVRIVVVSAGRIVAGSVSVITGTSGFATAQAAAGWFVARIRVAVR